MTPCSRVSTPWWLLAPFLLSLGCQSPTTEQSSTVDVLDDFEKDFFVAFGDPASWKAEDGVFKCTGTPNGYLCSRKSYSNYVLTLEFRYPEQAGNSGVFHYITGEHKVWPACVEVQGLYQRLAQIFPLGGAEGPRERRGRGGTDQGPASPTPSGTGSRSPRGTA